MNYNEFVDRVYDDLQDTLLLNHFKNVVVETAQVNKLQGEGYYGITVREIGAEMGVSLDLHQSFSLFEKGIPYHDLLTDIAHEALDGIERRPEISADLIADYASIKDKIMLEVVPTSANQEMLANIPHKDFGDISMVYRVVFDSNERGEVTTLMTNDLLNTLGIDLDTLHADVLESAPQHFPASLRSMREVLSDMSGLPLEMIPESPNGMYVATCNDSMRGAGCIFYPEFLKDAAARLQSDFFILPSSIHEVLLLVDDKIQSVKELESMVRDINRDEVAPKDRLSDTVYHYDSRKQLLERAVDHQNRVQQEHRKHRSRDEAR